MTTEHNKNSVKLNSSEIRLAWHQPVISRIEIRRTMGGSAGAVDSQAGKQGS